MSIDRARRLAAKGQQEQAAAAYVEATANGSALDYEYEDWLREALSSFGQHDPVLAGCVNLFLQRSELAVKQFKEGNQPYGVGVAEEHRGRWDLAAEAYEEAGMFAHAACAAFKGEQWEAAERLWGEFASTLGVDCHYERALVFYNHALAAAKTKSAKIARQLLVESLRQLEQVADGFLVEGRAERAFDCYSMLIQMGKVHGEFTNLSEGYLNCIQILKSDGLRLYSLQYYADYIDAAMELEEFHAAARISEEASQYANRIGLPYGTHFDQISAKAWYQCAKKQQELGFPSDMVESSSIAAAKAYCRIGDTQSAQAIFEHLAVEKDGTNSPFERLADKYRKSTVPAVQIVEFPAYLRQRNAYAEVWISDVLEWERKGSSFQLMLQICGNLQFPNFVRRHALHLALYESLEQGDEDSVNSYLARHLGRLQRYGVLAPLEKLLAHPQDAVRVGAVRSLGDLYYKKTFSLLRIALEDSSPAVRDGAIQVISQLQFTHALSELQRIFHEWELPAVRLAVIENLSHLQSVESARFLLEVCLMESGRIQDAALKALSTHDTPDAKKLIGVFAQTCADPAIQRKLQGFAGAS